MNRIFSRNILAALPWIGAVTAIVLIQGCEMARAAGDQDPNVSAFKYREVFLPEGIGDSAEALGLNTLEEDWGIWGHNLGKVVPEHHSQNIYAKQNGSTLKKQFCFSSNHLYEYIEEYIDSKYDEDEKIRFAIVPNDNDIVCICEKCVAVGNTRRNASPAAEHLVRRLAKRFPNHIFYTSDYRTTRSVPKDTMPSNTGVLVSAMNYPIAYGATPEEGRFMQRLQAWSETTPRILVWDYINNFDDYFTPYPSFGAFQRRLNNYKNNHVTAVFLNGSGPDISAMSRLRTEVLAELTANPGIDWKETLKAKANEIYPVSGNVIAQFMIDQEQFAADNGTPLPLYVGVDSAKKIYLPAERFKEFHDELLKLRGRTSGQERAELDLLLGQLALTRLELKRMKGSLKNSDKYLTDLHYLVNKGHESYSESGWSVDSYIRDFKFLLDHFNQVGGSNKLKGVQLMALTPLDPDYTDISILTDGVLGIPSNYHSGNLIVSPENMTQIGIPIVPGMKKVRVWLSYNPAYRIVLPETVTLTNKGKVIGKVSPTYPENGHGHEPVEFDLPGGLDGSLTLTLYKQPETHSMAIDEIEAF